MAPDIISVFRNTKCCVIGRHGFIGKALTKRLLEYGAVISSYPTEDTKFIFNFGGPTHLPFEENPDYFLRDMLNNFLTLLKHATTHDCLLVWPSSALVYEKDKETPFSHYKMAMEELQLAYSKAKVLGLRIFPTYGPGETNKGKYKTAIYQWCEIMLKGASPVIYGDGEQTRDFLYIDDLVDNLLLLSAQGKTGIMDIGVGKSISFNDIVKSINEVLGTDMKPRYIDRPTGYSKGIYCKNPVETKVDIKQGIKNIISSIG